MSYIVVTDSGELYHHGIKGQQWGVQNGPPYPLSAADHKKVAKSATKELNRIDQEISQNKYRKEASKKREELARISGNRSGVQTEKNAQKEIEKDIDAGQKQVDKIIKDLEKSGFSIEAKDLNRMVVAEGEDKVELTKKTQMNTILFGPIMGAMISLRDNPKQQGTKYKVR